MARPLSDRTPGPLLLGGPAGAPPGGGSAARAEEPSARNQQAQRTGQLSPEGKGAQDNCALSPRPGAGPGNGGPSRCPDGGGWRRWVPAGTLRASGWPEPFCAAAVGTLFAFRRRGIRGPGRLLAGARATAEPAAPGRPVAGTLSSAHARALTRARLLRLLVPSLLSRARPRAGHSGSRRRPPRRLDL